MKRLLLLIFSFGLFATAAYAHNGMEHVMGTVTAKTETSVSVKTMNGTDQTVALSNNTKFIKGENAISAKDIKVGDHVVIHASKKDGKLVAAEVKVGAMGSMKGMHGDMSGMDINGSSSKPR